MLLEFWDFARINSAATMPYLKGGTRASRCRLHVVAIHSPGYSFGRSRVLVERAVARAEVPYPVLLDPDLKA